MRSLTERGRSWVREAANLPEIIAERCVHTRIETAGCRACVDSCPQQAWVIDDEQLGIDTQRCDGCKLCVAACPEGAVQASVRPALRDAANGGAALLACQPAGVSGDDGVVPCVHALGLTALLSLYRSGVRILMTCTADCDQCERGGATRLQERVGHLNRLLTARGLPGVRCEPLSSDTWIQRLTHDLAPARGPVLSRRKFLRRATRDVLSGYQQTHVAQLARAAPQEPPGQMLPTRSAGQPAPYAVEINDERCNACHACARLCPHGAIALQLDEHGRNQAYLLRSDACTGCGICCDVCDQGAVRVLPWGVPPAAMLQLAQHRCRACGGLFELPVQHAGSALCRVCARRNHHAALYQVRE